MKVLKSLVSLVAIAALVLFSNCGDDPAEPSVEEQQLAKLTKAWRVQSVYKDSPTTGDRTAEYANFVLTLTGTPGAASFDYSTQGRPALSPWKASGKWSFGQSVETQIIRDPGTADELQMTYVVNENSLQVTFTFNGAGYTNPRVGVIPGNWVFNFVP